MGESRYAAVTNLSNYVLNVNIIKRSKKRVISSVGEE